METKKEVKKTFEYIELQEKCEKYLNFYYMNTDIKYYANLKRVIDTLINCVKINISIEKQVTRWDIFNLYNNHFVVLGFFDKFPKIIDEMDYFIESAKESL